MICERCGEDKPDVHTALDPYLKEIFDEEEEMTACEECFDQRRDDI